jgi:GDP-L-fucose synthase
MKILLTGGTGMCGQNILEHSKAQEHKILSPTSNELDLLEVGMIKDYLREHRPDFIIHTAGLVAGIQFNIKHPVRALTDNSYIGLNLIKTAYDQGIGELINLGSSCMYPRLGKNPLDERQILTGELEPTNEGYAIAKILSTRLCEYISKQDSTKSYKTLIPCNLYGRHDTFSLHFSHMIPAAIQKLHQAKEEGLPTVEVWGDGLTRREFMPAQDLADLVFFCIENFKDMPQNLNAGLGVDYSVNEYYEAAADVIGFKGDFWHNSARPVGMKQKLVDATLLRKFGWKNSLSLHEGLEIAYGFFLEQLTETNKAPKRKDAFIQ